MSNRLARGDKITRTVSFNSVKHKRILELARATGNYFSSVVQDALTVYFDLESGVTLGMIYSRQGEILRRLDSGVVISGGESVQDDDDGDTLSAEVLNGFG